MLTELETSDVRVSPQRFSERLGALIDLADSIKISMAHGKLRSSHFQPSGSSGERLLADFASARATLVKSVIGEFGPRVRTSLPQPGASEPLEAGAALEAYQKFYSARQGNLQFKIRHLHERFRDQVGAVSPALGQLCALDAVLGETMGPYSKKKFSAVPRLLARRIKHLHSDKSWNDTHQQVCREMQALLLAETEARLLPTVGLIEALDEHKDT
ncbi:MAG: hypothetical protein ACI9JM_001465 [Halioglobus sp.]|jgi:hypothetical protein